MSIANEKDLKGMKQAGKVAAKVIHAMRQEVQAGVTPRVLDEICGEVFKKHQAISAPRLMYGAPVNAFISVNDAVVHGLPTQRKLQMGDLVKLDVTPFVDGYVADMAISVAVPPVSRSTQKLISCVEGAFWIVMKVMRAGRPLNEVGRRIEDYVRHQGFQIIRELSGHGVGRTIHEEPEVLNFYNPSEKRVLNEGLVLAIEPMIADGNPQIMQAKDGWTIKTRDRALTAHFEHTVVITKNNPIILTL